MGACCSSDATAVKNRGDDDEHVELRHGTVHRSAGKSASRDAVREPTVSEKRRRAADAAEKRQADWRQGGASDPDKARALRMRRVKDELLGKIYNRYHVLGKEAPIGLPSCDIDQLNRHLESLE